jgi:3-oxoacyl-[acyl-carrier-protein] synthase-3
MEDIQLNKMALLQYKNVEIKGISSVVPDQVIYKKNYTDFISEKETDSVIKMTGIAQRRFASKELNSVDLCYQSAQYLVKNLAITIYSIDAIIMVTLTPDYRIQGSAFVLRQKLKLKKECFAFDIS